MSFPDLVIVKDQPVFGNETSPGCFSPAEGRRGGEAASFDLFLTPAGRPRFFGEAFLTFFVLAGGALLERIIFASYYTHKKLFKNSTIIIKATSCRFYAFVINTDIINRLDWNLHCDPNILSFDPPLQAQELAKVLFLRASNCCSSPQDPNDDI